MEAALLLDKLMKGNSPPAEPLRLPPGSLFLRRSTDAFNVDDEYVAQALRFIAEHCHRPIKVRDVIVHVPISGRSLERPLQEGQGSTISAEITRFRIERAKRLLLETEMLVKQVAEACGFANTRRLCEVFRRQEDCTPEEFRQRSATPSKR